jgi:signal peptidase II
MKVAGIAIALVGLLADLATKAWMQDLLGMSAERPQVSRVIDLIPGFLALEGTWNTGVTFGFAQGATSWILVFTVCAIAGLAVWLARTRVPGWCLHVGQGLILGGAIGNLHDRARWGMVRDFLLIYLGDLDRPWFQWPNFNVADSMIVVGVSLILVEELFLRRARERRLVGAPA